MLIASAVAIDELAVELEIQEACVEFEGRSATLFGYENDYFFQNINEHLHGAVTVNNELRQLPAGSVICDVGANVGTTALAASYIVPDCQVISFEPSPLALACLRRTVSVNNLHNVEIIEAAVGARVGQMAMAETEFLAGSHLLPVGKATRDAGTAIVSVVTLDDVLLRQKEISRLDLIKIDVEGFELDVLDGAMLTIERFRPRMVIEYGAFGIVVNADGSPLKLIERMLEIAGAFTATMPWGELTVVPDPKVIKDFIFANMKVGAQDIALSVRPDFVARNSELPLEKQVWRRSRNLLRDVLKPGAQRNATSNARRI
jgi:FkbM family methyltransferase